MVQYHTIDNNYMKPLGSRLHISLSLSLKLFTVACVSPKISLSNSPSQQTFTFTSLPLLPLRFLPGFWTGRFSHSCIHQSFEVQWGIAFAAAAADYCCFQPGYLYRSSSLTWSHEFSFPILADSQVSHHHCCCYLCYVEWNICRYTHGVYCHRHQRPTITTAHYWPL